MKKLTVILWALAALLCADAALARAGGGVSVGRSAPSVGRPSYSAPSVPRYTAPATPAPRAAPAPAAPATTTVVQQGAGMGGGFGSSFLGGAAGAVVGNMISHPGGGVVSSGGVAAAPAVMPVSAGGSVVGAPMVAVSTFPWGWLFFLVFLLIVGGAGIWLYLRNKKEEQRLMDAEKFDPLAQFYIIQQASMENDFPTLIANCTRGMAMALAGHTEPGREARSTLTGVTYNWWDEGCIEYRFTDTVNNKPAVERWQFDEDNKLDGITVVDAV